jgi:hypothetical protein
MSKQLKQQAIKALQSVSDTDTKTLNRVLSSINEPIIEANVRKWCNLKGLPPKAIDYLTKKIIGSSFSIEEKLELSSLLGNDKALLDFKKMYTASKNKTVDISTYYNYPKYADFIMNACKNDNDKQVLGASTNIGKGEIAFIIAGGLKKPTQGDLQDGPHVIELKEPTAGIKPHSTSHPDVFLRDIRAFIKNLTGVDLPKKDRIPGGGGPYDASACNVLTIKWNQNSGTGEFNLGKWAKDNKISLAHVRSIMKKYHKLVYGSNAGSFDGGSYVTSLDNFNYKKYGKDSFALNYDAYKKESTFKTLMVYSPDKNTCYTITTSNDAKKLFEQAGKVEFSPQDSHHLKHAYGGVLHDTLFKRLTNT